MSRSGSTMDSRLKPLQVTGFQTKKDLFDLVPNNESHHFHLDSSFTSAYEQELRAILESPLSSLAPSPIASHYQDHQPAQGLTQTCRHTHQIRPIQIYFESGQTSKKIQVRHHHQHFPIDKTFHWSRNRRVHFHFNMAGQQQAPAQNQQLPIRGSGKAPSWGWKGPEDLITLPVFFDEVERMCESVGQQTDGNTYKPLSYMQTRQLLICGEGYHKPTQPIK